MREVIMTRLKRMEIEFMVALIFSYISVAAQCTYDIYTGNRREQEYYEYLAHFKGENRTGIENYRE